MVSFGEKTKIKKAGNLNYNCITTVQIGQWDFVTSFSWILLEIL